MNKDKKQGIEESDANLLTGRNHFNLLIIFYQNISGDESTDKYIKSSLLWDLGQ
jgi:hypothetical protein